MKPGTQLAVSLTVLGAVGAAASVFALQRAAQPTGQPAARPAVRPTPVRYPTPDIGVEALPARAKAQRGTVSQFKVVYQFQFQDRVTESGITFVHRTVDDAARFHKLVHYDHGTGIAVADVDGDGLEDIYFVNQLGGNQLWKNLGGGKFRNITSEAGVALADRIGVTASFADIDNDGDQDLFVTTVRGGNVLFENDGRGHFKDISKARGRRLRRPLVGGGVLRLTTRRPARPVPLQRRAIHDRREGTRRRLRRASRRLLRSPSQRPLASLASSTRTWAATSSRTSPRRLGSATPAGAATRAWRTSNGDGFPDLYVLNMQGGDHYFENVGGKKFVDKHRAVLPEDAVGQHGRQVLRLRQRRPPRPAHHRHALGHERGSRPRAREAEVAHPVGRRIFSGAGRTVRLRQRLLRKSSEAESSRKSRTA